MENKRLKIALVCDAFLPMMDGVVMVIDNYARLLSKNNDVTVFAPRARDKNYKDNLPYRVVRCKILPINVGDYNMPLPAFDKNLKKIFKNEHFDIIHLHSPFTLPRMAIKYAKKQNTPVVITMHSQYYRDFLLATKSKFISKQLLKFVAKTFNSCNELWTMNPACEQLSVAYGYKGKIKLIPNGTNLVNNFSKQQITQYANEIKQKHNIKNDEKVFIYIGRMHKLKNLDFVIDVCKNLKDKNFKFKMIFVGGGAHFQHFEKRVKELNLQDVIVFAGRIYDNLEKSKYIMSANLQLFPSYYDTDGIVRIEAAAFNVPTVFIENSVAASVITDEVNGYVGKDDVELFSDKIINIFNDENKYALVRKNCKTDLYITWDSIVNNVLKNYKQIIDENNKKGSLK